MSQLGSLVKVSKVSSESTWRHGGPTPRPTTSKATFPKKTAGNLQPSTGRTDTHAVSDSTNCRSDTLAVSDSITPRGYASATFPQQKQQGNTPQTRPARTFGPPHSSWKQTDTLPGLRQTGLSTFLQLLSAQIPLLVTGPELPKHHCRHPNFLRQDHRPTLSHPNIKRPGL